MRRVIVLGIMVCTAALVGPLIASRAATAADRDPNLLAFENAGAYGFTESMPLFLSHEWPAEVGLRRGRLALLRRAPSVAELLAAQRQPYTS